MLSVVIQPFDYQYINSLEDIKSVSVFKFSKRAIIEEDYNYETVYDGELSEDVIKLIFDNLKDGNVITYSGLLLSRTLSAISNSKSEYAFHQKEIKGLMELYADKYPIKKKWHKLHEALGNYNYITNINTSMPSDVAKNTIVLYRFMQEDNKFQNL